MSPSVKLTDDLVKLQVSCDNSTHYLIWGHSGNTEIRSTAHSMLGRIFGADGVIHGLGPKRRINHHRLSSKYRFDFFKKLSQPLEVADLFLRWGIVQRPVVSYGQFFKGKVVT